MDAGTAPYQVPQAPNAGLCSRCRFAEIMRAAGRPELVLCRRAATDAAFARYPQLPQRECPGFGPLPTA